MTKKVRESTADPTKKAYFIDSSSPSFQATYYKWSVDHPNISQAAKDAVYVMLTKKIKLIDAARQYSITIRQARYAAISLKSYVENGV